MRNWRDGCEKHMKVLDKKKQIPEDLRLFTPRLVLRPPRLDDIPFIFSATRFKGFNDGMLWDPPKDIDELVEPYYRLLKARKDGIAYNFAIDSRSDSQPLGRISIRKTDTKDVWNVGFWTHPEHYGKGIMTEALGRIVKFGSEDLKAIRIEAEYALWNKGSEAVLTKNGFQFVKYIEKGYKKNGMWVDENLMAIEIKE